MSVHRAIGLDDGIWMQELLLGDEVRDSVAVPTFWDLNGMRAAGMMRAPRLRCAQVETKKSLGDSFKVERGSVGLGWLGWLGGCLLCAGTT